MPVSLRNAIMGGVSQLAHAHIDNPEWNARLLARHALGLNIERLVDHLNRQLTTEEIEQIQSLIDRRTQKESMNRILGSCEFWGMPFGINEATLEPRPDSEALIEATLDHFKNGIWKFLPNSRKLFSHSRNLRILDLGTGTGCLLLSLLSELPHASGLGIDIAPHAIEQAQKNAENLQLNGRVEFKVSNWLDSIGEKFDIIISNPPYIPAADIARLKPTVRQFDPYQALDGGEDGLDIYRMLVPQLPRHLTPTGLAVLEIGHKEQAQTVASMLTQANFKNIEVYCDFRRLERCVAGTVSRPTLKFPPAEPGS